MVVGVPGRVAEGEEALLPGAVGRVVDLLATLVQDHVALVVEGGLGEHLAERAHAIRLQPQRQLELVARQGIAVDRRVEAGVGVRAAPRGLHQVEVLALADVRRALEHHVFEEVREAAAPGRLVAGAHRVPQADSHHRHAAVGKDHDPQPVVEAMVDEAGRLRHEAGNGNRHGGGVGPSRGGGMARR